ncbi:MAG TPA: hypothetical protein VFB80_01085 [Pirellulaceae bacterium]|nr:hypothetical protein [Pirellulaceae bacterium]
MLLFLLRLLLNLLVPSGGDRLSLAARADGRVEQVPAEIATRDRWTSRKRAAAARRATSAPPPRASGEAPPLTDPNPS